MVFYIADIQRRLDLNLVLKRIQRHLWVAFQVSQSKNCCVCDVWKHSPPPWCYCPLVNPGNSFLHCILNTLMFFVIVALHCILYTGSLVVRLYPSTVLLCWPPLLGCYHTEYFIVFYCFIALYYSIYWIFSCAIVPFYCATVLTLLLCY